MNLVDTSVWIDILCDRSGTRRQTFLAAMGGEPVALARPIEYELLAGCRDEREWRLLASYLDEQHYLPIEEGTWREAARIDFDLRRHGLTVSGPVDCVLAQVALDHDAVLVHRDGDYAAIAEVRPLEHRRLDL